MNNQEQRNPSPSGRENHHICNRCGWTYPNPHPSAKLRRAHKKICGKPQGFKAIDSDDRTTHSGVSDDEQQQHHSDDDTQTPLPKIDQRLGSDGVREGTNRSEDESFSDAVTEFSDSAFSPGDLGKNVERTLEGDLDSSPLLKDDAKAGFTEPLIYTEDTKKIDEDEILANVPEHPSRNLSESFEAEIKAQETDGNTSTPLREDGVVQSEQGQGGSVLMKSNLPLEVESIHQNEENSAKNVDVSNHGDLEVLANTKTEEEAVHILSVAEDIPVIGDSDTLIEDFKDHHAVKSNIPLTLDSAEVISTLGDGEKDVGDKDSSTANMNFLEDSVNSAPVKEDFAQDTDVIGHGDLIEDSNTKGEGEEAVYVLSVAKDLHAAEHQIEDFKDHRVLKSEIPLVLGSADIVKPLGDGDKVPEDMISSSANLRFHQTTSLPGGDDTSEQEKLINELSDVHPNESTEAVIEAGKCAGNASQNLESENQCLETTSVEIIPVSADVDIDTSNSRNMIQNLPNSQKCADEDVQEVVEETKIDNDSEVVEFVDPVAVGSESNDRVDAEVLERMSEEPILKEQKRTDEDSQEVVKETKIDNDGEVVECVHPVAMGSESNDRVDAEVSERMSEEPILKEQKCLVEDSQEVVKETKIVNDGEVVECIGQVAVGSESNDGVDSEVSERISKEPILKEPGPGHLPYGSEQSILSCTTVEVSQNKDSEQVASAGTISEPMQEKGNDKLRKEHSAVDISADLSSQNSLEANWGSVSVLSTQSDAQAYDDSETSEKAYSGKSVNASDEHQLDRSDVFEPPSFMTVVERGGEVDQNAVFSAVEAVQNFHQPKPESLTNVSSESEERKKNEEVIAKVTQWSPGKHQSTPLKSLLGEADAESKQKSPDSKQPSTVIRKDEATAENNRILTTTVKSVLSAEAPAVDQSAKREAGNEWNSPARYPSSKKDRKKVKGKPSWVPFVCCSSVNVN